MKFSFHKKRRSRGAELQRRAGKRKSKMDHYKARLEELQAGNRIGKLTPEIQIWLNQVWKTNPDFYSRLTEAGLVESRIHCGTLAELAERFIVLPFNGKVPKPRTSRNRRVAAHMLFYFLANQRFGNFKHDEKAVQRVGQFRVDCMTQEKAERIFMLMRQTYQIGTWGRRIKHSVRGQNSISALGGSERSRSRSVTTENQNPSRHRH